MQCILEALTDAALCWLAVTVICYTPFGPGILNVNHFRPFSFPSHTVVLYSELLYQQAIWPLEVNGVSYLHIVQVLRHFAPIRIVWVCVFVIYLVFLKKSVAEKQNTCCNIKG